MRYVDGSREVVCRIINAVMSLVVDMPDEVQLVWWL